MKDHFEKDMEKVEASTAQPEILMDKSKDNHFDVELEQDLREIIVQNNEYLKQMTIFKENNHDIKTHLYYILNETKNSKEILTEAVKKRESEQNLLNKSVQNILNEITNNKKTLTNILEGNKSVQYILNELEKNKHQLEIVVKEKEFVEQKNMKYQEQVEVNLARVKRLEKEVFNLRRSTSFRLGQVFVKALAHPGKNTILMPFRFCKLVFEIVVTWAKGGPK